MDPQELKIGDIVDLTIRREPENTYIVGVVQGVRQDYFKVDQVAVLIGGIDLWLSLTDDVDVRLADHG